MTRNDSLARQVVQLQAQLRHAAATAAGGGAGRGAQDTAMAGNDS